MCRCLQVTLHIRGNLCRVGLTFVRKIGEKTMKNNLNLTLNNPPPKKKKKKKKNKKKKIKINNGQQSIHLKRVNWRQMSVWLAFTP